MGTRERELRQFKLLFYSQDIAWLGRLLYHKQITETEYQKIKQEIMKAYNVQSDLTAVTATK